MKSKKLFVGLLILLVIAAMMYTIKINIRSNAVSADEQIQAMQEIQITPNITSADKAYIPQNYGRFVGLENVGKSTMLWFEAANGTIRRVQVSFWEKDIILDDKVVTIERR